MVSENAVCFTAGVLQEFIKENGAEGRMGLSYEPRSNGRIEWKTGTIKWTIGRLVVWGRKEWDYAIRKALFGYGCRPMHGWASTFELLYCIKSSIPLVHPSESEKADKTSYRQMGIIVMGGSRLKRVDTQWEEHKKAGPRIIVSSWQFYSCHAG